MSSKKHILITGQPGIGKTTFIKRLTEELKEFDPVGFYTAEIRKEGIRKGFELISLSGARSLLSHTDIKSPFKVGKYGVDIKGFEDFLDSIPFLISEKNPVIIDEIGKMECFSNKFRYLIKEILASDSQLIATISLKGSGFIADIKKRNDVKLFKMTQSNRDSLISDVLREMK